MSEFKLQIVTPDGLLFDGNAQKLIVRTTEGEVGILARHSDYVAPLSTGVARIFEDGNVKEAACSGGMITVLDNVVRIVAETFEWATDIDIDRALIAKEKAQKVLNEANRDDYNYKVAEAKLRRSLARLKASGRKD